MEDAEEFAVSESKSGACDKAVEHGAKGDIIVTCSLDKNEELTLCGMHYLGTAVTAQAVGSIGF